MEAAASKMVADRTEVDEVGVEDEGAEPEGPGMEELLEAVDCNALVVATP